MPQMVFWPCMAGTMVEAATPVKAGFKVARQTARKKQRLTQALFRGH